MLLYPFLFGEQTAGFSSRCCCRPEVLLFPGLLRSQVAVSWTGGAYKEVCGLIFRLLPIVGFSPACLKYREIFLVYSIEKPFSNACCFPPKPTFQHNQTPMQEVRRPRTKQAHRQRQALALYLRKGIWKASSRSQAWNWGKHREHPCNPRSSSTWFWRRKSWIKVSGCLLICCWVVVIQFSLQSTARLRRHRHRDDNPRAGTGTWTNRFIFYLYN